MDELSSFLSSLVYYFQQRTMITMFAFIHFQIVSFHLMCSHLRLAEFPIRRIKKKKIPQQFGRRIADNLLVLEKGLEGTGGEYSRIILHTWRASLDSAEEFYLLPLSWTAEEQLKYFHSSSHHNLAMEQGFPSAAWSTLSHEKRSVEHTVNVELLHNYYLVMLAWGS